MTTIECYRAAIGLFNLHNNIRATKVSNKYLKPRFSHSLFLIFCLLLKGCLGYESYGLIVKKSGNKRMHSLNGNISKNGSYFLLNWNKGNRTYSNKKYDISITLDRYKPDFFAIQEANYNILKDKGFSGYNLEYNTLHVNCVISRTLLLIKKGINYKRRYDLETP